MTSILEGEMAAALTDALIAANVPYAITIVRSMPGEVDPEPGEPGTPVVVNYDSQGWTENFSTEDIDGTLILVTDLRAIVLLSTIAKAAGAPEGAAATITPAVHDLVTMHGKTYHVLNVAADPAGAIVRLQVRG